MSMKTIRVEAATEIGRSRRVLLAGDPHRRWQRALAGVGCALLLGSAACSSETETAPEPAAPAGEPDSSDPAGARMQFMPTPGMQAVTGWWDFSLAQTVVHPGAEPEQLVEANSTVREHGTCIDETGIHPQQIQQDSQNCTVHSVEIDEAEGKMTWALNCQMGQFWASAGEGTFAVDGNKGSGEFWGQAGEGERAIRAEQKVIAERTRACTEEEKAATELRVAKLQNQYYGLEPR